MARERISDEERAERERAGRARSSQRKFLEVQRKIILSQVYLEQSARIKRIKIAESETNDLLAALKKTWVSGKPSQRITSEAIIEGLNDFISPEVTGLSSERRYQLEYYRKYRRSFESSGFRLSEAPPIKKYPENDIFFHLSGYPYPREGAITSVNFRNSEGRREGLMIEDLVPNYLDRLGLTQLLAKALLSKKAI